MATRSAFGLHEPSGGLLPTATEIFTGLSKEQIGIIVAAGVRRRFKAFEIAGSSDQSVPYLLLVRHGCMEIHISTMDGREIGLGRLLPGDVFEMTPLVFDPKADVASVQAVRDTEVLMWEQRIARHFAMHYPQLMENALRIALRYLGKSIRRHVGLASVPAYVRLARVLREIADAEGRPVSEGLQIEVRNVDLASLADVSVFTASRRLKQLERRGTLRKLRGKIIVRHLEELL